MLKRLELVNDWYFSKEYLESDVRDEGVELFERVHLPHNPVDLPFHYLKEKDFQILCSYRKFFEVPQIMEGQRVNVRFEGVMAYARVYLNGTYLGEHKGGYTPFEFEITNKLKAEGMNCLTVYADSRELPGIPPFGGQIDYLTYAGIYREVYLDLYPPVYIEKAKFETIEVLGRNPKVQGKFWVNGNEEEAEVVFRLIGGEGEYEHKEAFRIKRREDGWHHFETGPLADISLWEIEAPCLYKVSLELKTGVGTDYYETHIGFREIAYKAEGFYLNGKRVQLRGLNRHQSWPYVGYAMPKRVQEKDADILKYELGVNIVRTSHYPQSIHFLNRCDELGLLVFEEIPGWQYIGDEDWRNIAVENVREMIERDWNHPSVVIWGVRINESPDHHDFYTKTNQMARTLDQTRYIGGVRCIPNSELIEDVYTMNDFAHEGGEVALLNPQVVTGRKDQIPYLVTEYNGHMYPTKKTDPEERQVEHVLRHLRVQNEAHKNAWISGAIGWCAFDYNTHKDFGAGDRICYHGVMDMFRTKKFAADVYASQMDPKDSVILKAVTYWARGERSIGGILPLVVLTNCDWISLQFGDFEPVKLQRKSSEFDDLPHPPFIISTQDMPPGKFGEWGMKWEDGILRGYLGNEMVAEEHLAAEPVATRLSVRADDLALSNNRKDATRVLVSLLDQNGRPLPFSDAIVSLRMAEESKKLAKIQGPSRFALKGGTFGFYVETLASGESGVFELIAECDGVPAEQVRITIR